MQSTIESLTQYKANQLLSLLEDFQHQHVSGTIYFTASMGSDSHERSRVLVLRNGEIVYGDTHLLDNVTFVKTLGKKLDRRMVETAVNFAVSKLTNKDSTRELVEMVMRLRSLTWAEVETLVSDRVVQTLEQLFPYAGQIRIEQGTEADNAFDLTPTETGKGLDWQRLKQRVEQRQQLWQNLAPFIPSMDAIPKLKAEGLAAVTDASVRQQLQQQVDGKSSLVEIAERLDVDPLVLGRSYLMWVESGWVTCKSELQASTGSTPNAPPMPVPTSTSNRPLILSVDDSQIVQTTIKRILGAHYDVMLANSAIAALNILNANSVDVLLLDVTMPEVDGLEFCKTLRGIPKFKNLPIVMVTAKDTLIDKFQGFMAGSNQYLYKPIEAAHLLEVVGSLIKS
jgi:CheY-like chemotaxis protein